MQQKNDGQEGCLLSQIKEQDSSLSKIFVEYQAAFAELTRLPPARIHDHGIPLMEEEPMSFTPFYCLQKDVLEKVVT